MVSFLKMKQGPSPVLPLPHQPTSLCFVDSFSPRDQATPGLGTTFRAAPRAACDADARRAIALRAAQPRRAGSAGVERHAVEQRADLRALGVRDPSAVALAPAARRVVAPLACRAKRRKTERLTRALSRGEVPR